VENRAALTAFEAGAESGGGSEFQVIFGTTGGADHLAITYDTSVVEPLGHEERREVQLGNPNLRAPLLAHFRGKRTGQEFKFIVNHFPLVFSFQTSLEKFSLYIKMGIRFAQRDVMRCAGGRYQPAHRPRGVVDYPRTSRSSPFDLTDVLRTLPGCLLPHAGERRPGSASVN